MTAPTITISPREYLALQSAADLLRDRADQLTAHSTPAAAVEVINTIADRVQAVHDRWHAAVVTDERSPDHGPCSWCDNAAKEFGR